MRRHDRTVVISAGVNTEGPDSPDRPRVSIVIPSRSGESEWIPLLAQISALPSDVQVVLSTSGGMESAGRAAVEGLRATRDVIHVDGSPGRGIQLNRGAAAATGSMLWFVHADTRFTPDTFASLLDSFRQSPESLFFFRLRFYDGGALMRLTEAGVTIRANLLGIPFGDQAFCIGREAFQRCGGYDEVAPYGEDHLFLWKARRLGIPVRCTGGSVETSAAKYIRNGWIRMTVRHGVLTWKQALPQMLSREGVRP